MSLAGAVHLIGIGGVGMSALAQAFVDAGFAVTGADRSLGADGDGERSPVLAALERQGVRLFPDDGSGVDSSTARVVISTAVEDTNAGLRKARELGIPVTHRAAALAEVLSPRRLVAVAGTCGKSTVAAILGHLLVECGFDPVVVNGAQIAGWDEGGARVGSTRKGGGGFAVAEVDESDKSLVAFRPYAAIVTNASADHYSKEEMDAVFDAFLKDVPGPVVDGRRERIEPSPPAREIPMPGEHNAVNAECAIRMARLLGAAEDAIARAVRTFPGVERRLQRVGTLRTESGEVAVFDDYAHNPEKLHAMLVTLQTAYPKGVAAVWRPHGFAPLRKMKDALAEMFRATLRAQDLLVLLPVFDAGGTTDRSMNTDALAADLEGAPVALAAGLDEAEKMLRGRAEDFGAFAVCGARDPGLPVLARRLANPVE